MQFGVNSRIRGRAGLLAAVFLAFATSASAQTTFVDVADSAGIGVRTETYGAAWGDVNGDRYPDLFLNNHRLKPSLYLNMGDGTFFDISDDVRPFVNRSTADQHGGSFADFDSDGDLDLLISLGTGNPSQFLENDFGAYIDKTDEYGVGFENLGGRMPVWLDYNDDGRLDFVMTQFGGAAKVFRQTDTGFVEETSEAGVLCLRFQFGLLLDTFGDGRLDFVCPDDASFPQKIYDTSTLPWTDITSVFPQVPQVADAILADFDNNGRMDMFLISNVQLRPSSILQVDGNTIEANLSGGEKGFNFISDGPITIDLDWNKLEDGLGLPKIRIGANEISPFQIPFTLNPADPNVQGMPQSDPAAAPIMRLGYDDVENRWTIISQTENIFSEAYYVVTTSQPVTDLHSTGLWPSDQGGEATLITDQSGVYTDTTALAGLTGEIECVSATAGDFDNDMDVDLYLACRTGAENLENKYFDNDGTGVFTLVPGAGGATGPVGSNVTSGSGKADSVIAADFDLDGFLDLAITNGVGLRPKDIGGPNNLYRNQGNGNHWIQIDLVATVGTREPIGARVTATANGVSQYRVYNGSYHRWSQDSTRMHFGLAGETEVDLVVQWPDGTTENYPAVAADQVIEITQGSGLAPVTAGNPGPYACGKPTFDPATDPGAYVWRDCVNDEWKVRVAAAGLWTVYNGRVRSADGFSLVEGFSIEDNDTFDATSDPTQIVYSLGVGGSGQDGFDLTLAPGSRPCFELDTPAGLPVIYGRFSEQLQPPFDLLTGGACVGLANEISVMPPSVGESDGTLDFVLVLSEPANETITANAATADGTATAGSDYTAVGPLTVTFLPGETEQTVSVPILDDAFSEPNETVLLNLSSPAGATLASVQVTGTIVDDEASACNEPTIDAGSEAGVFVWNDCGSDNWFVRITAGGSPTTFIYDGTVVSGQAFTSVTPFSNEGSDVLDNASDPLQIVFSQRMVNTGVDGFNYTLATGASACFDISAPAGAPVYVGQNKTLVATPFDPGTLGACGSLPPAISVNAPDADENSGVLSATVTLSEASTNTVTVDVQTADDTAHAGSDYVAIPLTTLTFLPGETSKPLNVVLLDDAFSEGPETFAINLSNVSNATLGAATTIATINDDELSPCNEPVVDASTEQGVFVWKDCSDGSWRMRVAAGGQFTQYAGEIISTAPFGSVTGFSIEASDVLDSTTDPLKISYELTVSGSGRDGIDFVTSPASSTCLAVSAPSTPNVFVGVNKVPVPQPFDIDTLGACSALPPEVSISDISTAENAGDPTVTITLSEASAETVTVDVASADGSAIAGQDFVALSIVGLEFAPGETSKAVSLDILDDVVAEGNETLTISLSNVANAALGQMTATITITDNEASPCGQPSYDAATEAGVFVWKECSANDWRMVITGGGSFVSYTGSLQSSQPFDDIEGFSIEASDTLDFVTDPSVADFVLNVSGSGADGINFTPMAGTTNCLAISAPAATSIFVGAARIPVSTSFSLETLASCGVLPTISIADATVNEGDVADLNVYLDRPSASTVEVDYQTVNGTATAPADYSASSGTLSIPAGMMSAILGVPVVDDSEIESTENFTVGLSSPQAASLGDASGLVTIGDNDAATISVADVTVLETSAIMTFTATLSTSNVVPVTVEYATGDVDATAGSDYTGIPTTLLTFNPGELVKTIDVQLSNDAITEGDESLALLLSNAAGASIATPMAIGTITDDEPQPVLSIGDASAAEGAGVLTFTAALSLASANDVSFDVSTVDGSASGGIDFDVVSTTVVIPAGSLSTPIQITLQDDLDSEGDETFSLAISNLVRATLSTPVPTGTINDDETIPMLTIEDVVAGEMDSTAVFTATLSAASAATVSVDYTTVDGSATAGLDYQSTSGTLTFLPGEISKTIDVTLLDDLELEFDEFFQLQLSNASQAVPAATTITATIVDDEALVCGEPSYDPASEAVVALWADCGTNTWHLRTTAGSGFRSYAGNVYSNQGFESVTGVSVEAGDTLNFTTDPSKIVFTLGMLAPGFDGFDFDVAPDASMCIGVSVGTTATIIVGASSTVVPSATFDPRTLEACEILPEVFVTDIEVDEDGGVAVFDLNLSMVSSDIVSVDYSTVDLTAVGGEDFVAVDDQTVQFLPGETSKSVSITLINDSNIELTEEFGVLFDGIVGASFGIAQISRTAIATIADDEVALAFNVADAAYDETAGVVDVQVGLTLAATETVSVDVATADATAGSSDYAAIPLTTVTFLPGEVQKTVPLTIFDDNLAEGDETLTLSLSNPIGAPIAQANATIAIIDDEPTPCGPPAYSPATDSGVLIWKDCSSGQWEVRFAAADGFKLFTGAVSASAAMSSVTPLSIEANDTLDFVTDPQRIDFTLRVGAGYDDGFQFVPDAAANVCVSLTGPLTAGIFLGSAKVPVTGPFYLHDLSACDPANP